MSFFQRFQRQFYLAFSLFLLVLVATSLFATYQSFLQSSERQLLLQGGSKVVPLGVEEQLIRNATFSAVAKVNEKVVTGKALAASAAVTSFVTQKGNELLVLVNKSISLPSTYVPGDLVLLNPSLQTSGKARLRNQAAKQLAKMFAAAKTAEHSLVVTSAFRSYSEQVSTFNYWVAYAGLEAAKSFSARAGHSQHQLGTAADISAASVGYKLTQSFGSTTEGKWLAKNAYLFGFVLSYPKGKEKITGYSYEPWHFRYIGLSSAKKMRDLGLDLETFLKSYGVW
ncbi:MAG: M15 family metallopeptidase [bacterium]|nr:M15 family metallopeptidase [bacterium]